MHSRMFALLDSRFLARVGNVGTLLKLLGVGVVIVIAAVATAAQLLPGQWWIPVVCIVAWLSVALPVLVAWRRNVSRPPVRDAKELEAHAEFHRAVAKQVTSGRRLRAEMRDAKKQGVWDHEGHAYRERLETWTDRTVTVLDNLGERELVLAIWNVKSPSPSTTETVMGGSRAALYGPLIGLLDGRIAVLEESDDYGL